MKKRLWKKGWRMKKIFATIIAITTIIMTFILILTEQSSAGGNGYGAPVKGVPVLTPIGIIALIGVLAIFAVIIIKKKQN